MQKTPAIICDLDGTLALRGDRDPYNYLLAIEDVPYWAVIHMVKALYTGYTQAGYPVVLLLVSGREDHSRHIVEYWLSTHDIFDSIPRQVYLREDNDNRRDAVVKEEIYNLYIKPTYEVLCVIDDRKQVVRMWRNLGLLCLQVAEGDF